MNDEEFLKDLPPAKCDACEIGYHTHYHTCPKHPLNQQIARLHVEGARLRSIVETISRGAKAIPYGLDAEARRVLGETTIGETLSGNVTTQKDGSSASERAANLTAKWALHGINLGVETMSRLTQEITQLLLEAESTERQRIAAKLKAEAETWQNPELVEVIASEVQTNWNT